MDWLSRVPRGMHMLMASAHTILKNSLLIGEVVEGDYSEASIVDEEIEDHRRWRRAIQCW